MSGEEPKVRVCLLIGNFHPVVGGGEKHARLLAREMTRRDARVIVVTRRRHPELSRRETMDGFDVHRVGPAGFPRIGKYLMVLPAIRKLRELRKEYDVIYVCGLRVLGFAGIIARALTGKPCVLRAEALGEMNGDFIWKSPEGSVSVIKKLVFAPMIALRNMLYRRADGFLSISTPVSEEFASSGVNADKLKLIPNGIDLDEFREADPERKAKLRKKLGLPGGTVFAYSGKLNRGKGLELLLRVWGEFFATRRGVHLVLIGSGKGQYLSCEEELRKFTRLYHLTECVTFAGYVDSVPDYLAAADAFVFPSESETMGLVVLEALACGVPVIASRIPGIMDIIRDGENGRLVDAKDESAWIRALEEFLARRSVYDEMSELGMRDVQKRFGIRSVAKQHIKYFASLKRS